MKILRILSHKISYNSLILKSFLWYFKIVQPDWIKIKENSIKFTTQAWRFCVEKNWNIRFNSSSNLAFRWSWRFCRKKFVVLNKLHRKQDTKFWFEEKRVSRLGRDNRWAHLLFNPIGNYEQNNFQVSISSWSPKQFHDIILNCSSMCNRIFFCFLLRIAKQCITNTVWEIFVGAKQQGAVISFSNIW